MRASSSDEPGSICAPAFGGSPWRRVMSVDAYIGALGGSQGVKLEEQTIIGDDGPETISKPPHDERLLA
jgi:hypothetical protein